MGTLSGGGTEIISVGENCLIGANAGIGFLSPTDAPLKRVCMLQQAPRSTYWMLQARWLETVKAAQLSKERNLLFRRNSLSGAVEALPQQTQISLNQDLHSNN